MSKEMHNYFMQLMLKTFIKSRQAAAENTNLTEYNNELADAEAEFEKGN